MGIGASVFLIAVGAILTFAINVSARGIDLGVVGIILMLLGAVGLFADMVIFGDRNRFSRRSTVVEDRDVIERPVVSSPVVEERYVEDVPVSRRRVVRERRDII